MTRKGWVRTGAVGLALFVVLAGLRLFIAEPARVAGESMAPTLHGGQVVLVDRLAADDVERGDVIVFESPDDHTAAVKRVLGVAGDRVTIRDAVLLVNGVAVEEPYVDSASIDGLYTPTYRVPDGHVFVLGDNRARSLDSRTYGPVDLDAVRGRVLLRLWPLW